MKSMRTLMFAGLAAAGLALAGCGGSGTSQSDLNAERDKTAAAQMERDALQTQIDALRTALGLEPGDDAAASIQELRDEVARLRQAADDAEEEKRMAAEEEARKMAAATGKALFAALDGPEAGGNALANIDTTTTPLALSATEITIDATAGAGSLGATDDPGAVTLKAGDSAGSLDGWAGTNYAHTNTGTKVVNAAVVYNNKGPGRTRSYAQRGNILHTAANVGTAPAYTAIRGYLTVAEAGTIDSGANIMRVMADAFTHSGLQNHATNSDTGIFTTRGTYDGAPGVYRCTGTCTSTNDNKGSPSALGGTWHFKPDAGASAMAHEPDANYLYYGWWVSKDKDGDPTAASVFTGVVGSIEGDGTTVLATNPNTLGGSATYAGHAAGKFALDYSKNKVLDGASDGGHFTADATLTAKFDATATGGVTGTIDNFRLNDGTEDPGWSVALHRAPWDGSTAGAFASQALVATDTIAQGTTWSIDGTSAPESGSWSGQAYDEMPGNAPNGDGSNVPTTVTGTFYSEFDSVGRMVGAFGADKE